MTDAKITMITKMVLNMNLIPPIPKKGNEIIANSQYDVSKLLISLLVMHREQLKEISPDIYEIVLRIVSLLIIQYETNERFRKDFDEKIEPAILNYAGLKQKVHEGIKL